MLETYLANLFNQINLFMVHWIGAHWKAILVVPLGIYFFVKLWIELSKCDYTDHGDV